MANLMCIFANKGHYYTPHFVKQIDKEGKRAEFTQKKSVLIDSNHFNVVIDAMSAVVNQDGGTARRARIDSIEVCGKTGTVQNKNKKDHAVFVAFAPRNNPQIAIAVYVEYSGFGGTWAAPIASLMMEKYLKGEVHNKEKEQYILEADLINNVLIK
jgi:penicillin-binding protein 2